MGQYSQLLDAFSNASPQRVAEAEQLFQRMHAAQVHPNRVTLNILKRTIGPPRTQELCGVLGFSFDEIMADRFDPNKQKRLLSPSLESAKGKEEFNRASRREACL